MSKAVLAARFVLGAILVVFGLNGFLHFLPQPPLPEGAMKFAGALFETGYMFPFIKLTEIVSGVLLLIGYVPLGLVLVAPVVLNILFFHGFLAPEGLPLPLVMLALGLFLAWSNKQAFTGIFRKS